MIDIRTYSVPQGAMLGPEYYPNIMHQRIQELT